MAFAFVLLKFVADARLDEFRQQMFLIRDELFDYAAAGKINFDEGAYRLLRKSMNGFIRYGHQLTFFRLCVTMVELKLQGKNSESKWTEDWHLSLEKVRDDEVRATLEQFHERAMTCVAERVIFGSPALISLVVCSVPFLMARLGWLNLKQIRIKAPFFTLSHVLDTRIIENEAAAAAVA
ncbi:MAG: hypothetical protein ACYDCG_02095 [Candidatus Acidiferrales bacterium]